MSRSKKILENLFFMFITVIYGIFILGYLIYSLIKKIYEKFTN